MSGVVFVLEGVRSVSGACRRNPWVEDESYGRHGPSPNTREGRRRLVVVTRKSKDRTSRPTDGGVTD